MRHRLFNIVSIISLVLCLLLTSTWIHLYFRGSREDFGWRSAIRRTGLTSRIWNRAGRVQFFVESRRFNDDRTWQWYCRNDLTGATMRAFMMYRSPLGASPMATPTFVEWERGCDRGPTEVVEARRWATLEFPHWLLLPMIAATLLLPAAMGRNQFRRWLRRKLSAAGLCADCAYDLRATADRCPECGTVPARKKKEISN